MPRQSSEQGLVRRSSTKSDIQNQGVGNSWFFYIFYCVNATFIYMGAVKGQCGKALFGFGLQIWQWYPPNLSTKKKG